MHAAQSELAGLQRWESDGGAVLSQDVIPRLELIHRLGPVASCQDARVGLLVASFDRARLVMRAPALLVVSVSSCPVRAWIRRWTAAGLIRQYVRVSATMSSTVVVW